MLIFRIHLSIFKARVVQILFYGIFLIPNGKEKKGTCPLQYQLPLDNCVMVSQDNTIMYSYSAKYDMYFFSVLYTNVRYS